METNMNSWVLNAYSEVYSTAMMQDVKPNRVAAIAKKVDVSAVTRLLAKLNRA
jgi:hypothetical protein